MPSANIYIHNGVKEEKKTYCSGHIFGRRYPNVAVDAQYNVDAAWQRLETAFLSLHQDGLHCDELPSF